MTTEAPSEARILASWSMNAVAWTEAVRAGRIDSRIRVTDRAVLDAVTRRAPRRVLDIGCGEGWLARALAARDVRVVGIDAIPELVAQARAGGGGEFRTMPYEDLDQAGMQGGFDALVCNFSLLGKASVEAVFNAAPRLVCPRGAFVVQTLHPVVACRDRPYVDGWREGSWAGCGEGFADPAPWYFRTLQSWTELFADSGFRLSALREPLDPLTGKPASALFIATLA